MMLKNLPFLEFPLPEDILKAKWCGDFSRAQWIIDLRLKDQKTPECLKARLRLERSVLDGLALDYTLSEEEGLALIQRDIPDFTLEELRALEDSSAVDWIYREGKPCLSRKFYDTLLKVYPEIAKRAGILPEEDAAGKQLLLENIKDMQKNGFAKWHIHIEASLHIAQSAFIPGKLLKVHLPLPKDAVNMQNIKILSTSPAAKLIAPADAPQRTAYFEVCEMENRPFTVEYEYDSFAEYHQLDPQAVSPQQPCFDTEEQPPHICFTPFLKALCKELSGTETNPLLLARRFYDYCTKNVTYSYMREYRAFTQIPEYAALNLKGDCGVQALLFITLCRLAGIPARWQSGLFITPYSQGSHDWAQFYIAPFGWLFADPSFGGSCYRANDKIGHEHYFGSLDPFRMAANSEFQAEFTPEKCQPRSDPYDNQKGEAEYEDRGLKWNETDRELKLLDMKKLS